MKLAKVVRIGATGMAMGAASYAPVALLASGSQPAGAVPTMGFGGGYYFTCQPHGHIDGWYGPDCFLGSESG